MVSHSGLMTIMDRAARKAGAKLRRDFNEVQHLQVSRKGPADFVSKADQQAERTIYDELLHARPDWGFLMEEGGEIPGLPDKPRWIVDPLDGTSNFLHGIPHFAISIAVEETLPNGKTEITSALVYQPLTDESFWAEKGRGAWLQDQRLRVSARRDMSEALIATGIPWGTAILRSGAGYSGRSRQRLREFAGSARRRLISLGSRRGALTDFGRLIWRRGMWLRAC
jgi:myo-inositol-1(or 4)-monophosphatase